MLRLNLVERLRAAIFAFKSANTPGQQAMLMRDAARAFMNRQFELSPGGVLFPKLGLFIGGAFHHRACPAGGQWEPWAVDPNVFTNQGLNNLLNAAFGAQSAVSTWYIAPFRGDVTPDSSWTGANFTANSTEFTAYTPSTRPLWDLTGNTPTSSESIGNTGNEAVITFTSGGPYNLYGLGLLSSSVKSATTSSIVCAAATRFDNPRLNQNSGDRLGFGYVITAADGS
ncbi:MAG: hypothetical protein JSS23_00140 [Proteobacteria bacterium]|nr:hypothetical protein [Pseudomonadota bacterium]